MRAGPLLTVWLAASLCGCASFSAARRAALEADAEPSRKALEGAHFDEAMAEAQRALTRNLTNSRAAGVYAVALYQRTLRELAADAVTFAGGLVASGLLRGNFWNRELLALVVKRADQRLDEVDRALAVAQDDQGFSLELCPACWAVDWNGSGELDAWDQHLLEVELDAKGEPLPPDDARRRPTFRFDWADVFWLRSMVAFQRAALALLVAWEPQLKSLDLAHQQSLRLSLRDAEQVHHARALLLQGLAAARDCRKALELERDDDREWLPNPHQQSHAIPLEVDQALFDTWAQTVDDVEALVRGQQGLELKALPKLAGRAGPTWGFVDVAHLLEAPTDLVVPLQLGSDAESVDRAFRQLFGAALKVSMAPSPLPQRLERLSRELDRGEDTLRRKLKYLLWLN